VIEAGEPGAPVMVLTHGFPELAYSCRHQIPVLATAGYHVLAPDQRGRNLDRNWEMMANRAAATALEL
jgi:pimeloyl-ACP methyl ester carboxylesterase